MIQRVVFPDAGFWQSIPLIFLAMAFTWNCTSISAPSKLMRVGPAEDRGGHVVFQTLGVAHPGTPKNYGTGSLHPRNENLQKKKTDSRKRKRTDGPPGRGAEREAINTRHLPVFFLLPPPPLLHKTSPARQRALERNWTGARASDSHLRGVLSLCASWWGPGGTKDAGPHDSQPPRSAIG